jgi:hypothetical protein
MGLGDYTVNFTTAMADANSCASYRYRQTCIAHIVYKSYWGTNVQDTPTIQVCGKWIGQSRRFSVVRYQDLCMSPSSARSKYVNN